MKAHMEVDPTFDTDNITLAGVMTEYPASEGLPAMLVGGEQGVSMTVRYA